MKKAAVVAMLMTLTGCTPIWQKWDEVVRQSDLFWIFLTVVFIIVVSIRAVEIGLARVNIAHTKHTEKLTSRLDDLEQRIQSLEWKD